MTTVAGRGADRHACPQPAPIEYYRAARDRGEAAVEQRYWDLVDGAFADLGPGSRSATAPRPRRPTS
ncbi:MAG: hypothetical protein R2697_17115 [Ilumatobacteraceae bacterium]